MDPSKRDSPWLQAIDQRHKVFSWCLCLHVWIHSWLPRDWTSEKVKSERFPVSFPGLSIPLLTSRKDSDITQFCIDKTQDLKSTVEAMFESVCTQYSFKIFRDLEFQHSLPAFFLAVIKKNGLNCISMQKFIKNNDYSRQFIPGVCTMNECQWTYLEYITHKITESVTFIMIKHELGLNVLKNIEIYFPLPSNFKVQRLEKFGVYN